MGHYDLPSDQELIDELYHKSRSALEETATLRDQLAEAERTIGALKHRIGEIEDERGATIRELREQIRLANIETWNEVACAQDAQRERDEARRVAVWAARNSAEWYEKECCPAGELAIITTTDPCNLGTDDEVYAALRRAMGESE